nr:MAG TPA: hypothetical protein [Caudoviricetes sp.]
MIADVPLTSPFPHCLNFSDCYILCRLCPCWLT